MKNFPSKTAFLILIVICIILGFSVCKKYIDDEAKPNDNGVIKYDKQPAVCFQGNIYYVLGKPVDSLAKGYEEVGNVIGISSSEFPYNDFEANDIELDGNTIYYQEEKKLIAIEWDGRYIEYGKPKGQK